MKLLVYDTECDVDQPNDLEPVEYVHDIKCSGTQADLTASIQRGNAAAVLGTSPPGDTDPIFMR